MPELTPEQINHVVADYEDMAAMLEMLARRYSVDPKGRRLGQLKTRAACYRTSAANFKSLLEAQETPF